MPMQCKTLIGLVLLLATAASAVQANDILVSRIHRPFTDAMPQVRQLLIEAGFTIAKVQRVDKAMQKVHYETAEYRIIHFGQALENQQLLEACPPLLAWLPLRLTLAAERDQTLLFTLNPAALSAVCGEYPQFAEWETKLRAVLSALTES